MSLNLSEFLNPTAVLLVGILTYLVTKNSNKHSVARDRLNNAYHPIFLAIEPHIYKEVNIKSALDFIDRFNEINKKHSLFIYPSLRHRVVLLNESILHNQSPKVINEHWKIICSYIDTDYDKLCRLAHMPLRSTAYRINHNQYSSKHELILGVIELYLPSILFFLMLFVSLIYSSKP